MCGYLGMVEHLGTGKSDRGLDLIVWGRVPPSAGLSSSSAFVCASALITATLLKEDAKITKVWTRISINYNHFTFMGMIKP